MNNIAQAWYAEEQTLLPANPAGEIELMDEELTFVNGAQSGPVALSVSNIAFANPDTALAISTIGFAMGTNGNSAALLGSTPPLGSGKDASPEPPSENKVAGLFYHYP